MWDGTSPVATGMPMMTKNAWHTLRLTRFFTGQVSGDIDGVSTGLTTSFSTVTHSTFNTMRIWNFKPDSETTPAVAYMDDYVLQAVPEPGTIAALALGALRRRRVR